MCFVNENSDRHKRGQQFVRIYFNKLDRVCLCIKCNRLHFTSCSGQMCVEVRASLGPIYQLHCSPY